MSNDPRAELASIAASLRAYLERQHDCGSVGIPRRARGAEAAAAAVAAPTAQGQVATAPRGASPLVAAAPRAPAALRPTAVTAPAPPPGKETTPAKENAPLRPLPVVMEEVKACVKCALHATRENTVFSRGNPLAKLCFVGEAPGADEDAQGLPFVGRAGQLLDKMIGAMGLDPNKDVYVCNIIKCRPPGNRKPEPVEIETCIPYLHEQLGTVDPRVIVAMGNTAVGALLGTKLGITKVRGAWKLYRGKVPVMPTYHPSYLLRPGPTQAEAKRQAWADLQAVMTELGITKPARG